MNKLAQFDKIIKSLPNTISLSKWRKCICDVLCNMPKQINKIIYNYAKMDWILSTNVINDAFLLNRVSRYLFSFEYIYTDFLIHDNGEYDSSFIFQNKYLQEIFNTCLNYNRDIGNSENSSKLESFKLCGNIMDYLISEPMLNCETIAICYIQNSVANFKIERIIFNNETMKESIKRTYRKMEFGSWSSYYDNNYEKQEELYNKLCQNKIIPIDSNKTLSNIAMILSAVDNKSIFGFHNLSNKYAIECNNEIIPILLFLKDEMKMPEYVCMD